MSDAFPDKACDESVENDLKNCALAQEGVLGVDLLRTRVFGNRIYVDIELLADVVIYPDGFVKVLDVNELAIALEKKLCDPQRKLARTLMHLCAMHTKLRNMYMTL